VDALAKHDADRAVQASLEHVLDSGRWLVEYLKIPADLLKEKEQQVTHLLKKSK
jgi:DNA-binding GntR family transcriptional regulator